MTEPTKAAGPSEAAMKIAEQYVPMISGNWGHQMMDGKRAALIRDIDAAIAAAVKPVRDSLDQFLRDTTDGFDCLPGCDSYGHEELCPFTNPLAAWHQMQESIRAMRTMLEKLRMEQDEREWLDIAKLMGREGDYLKSCVCGVSERQMHKFDCSWLARKAEFVKVLGEKTE